MLTMAFYAFSNGQRTGMGKLWGHVNEIFQKVTGSSSEYDPEDIPSNNLGAQFGKSLQIETLLSVQLELFLIQAGVNMNDQASLDAFKKAIEEYNSSHQNDEENCYSDSNPPPESNATNAANESMWARKDHPSGYRGRE